MTNPEEYHGPSFESADRCPVRQTSFPSLIFLRSTELPLKASEVVQVLYIQWYTAHSATLMYFEKSAEPRPLYRAITFAHPLSSRCYTHSLSVLHMQERAPAGHSFHLS